MLVIFSKIYFLVKNFYVGVLFIKVLVLLPNHTLISISGNSELLKPLGNNKLIGLKVSTVQIENSKYNLTVLSELEKVYKKYGLADISGYDSSIIVDLRYSTHNNFLSKDLYGGLTRAYFQQEVAESLAQANKKLAFYKTGYRLVILDAARPLSHQKQMWNEINLPYGQKEKYLANPSDGSLHNYGAAADVTIAGPDGNYIDMGTPYDTFTLLSYPLYEQYFIKTGQLTEEQVSNRELLRKVMKETGFSHIETEWWHFNYCSRKSARKNYSIIVSHIFADNPGFIEKEIKAQKPVYSETPVSTTDAVSYRVQVMTSAKPLTGSEELFNGLSVEGYFHSGLYKYTSGNFSGFSDACKHLQALKQKGFPNSFVVVFINNKRIGIKYS